MRGTDDVLFILLFVARYFLLLDITVNAVRGKLSEIIAEIQDNLYNFFFASAIVNCCEFSPSSAGLFRNISKQKAHKQNSTLKKKKDKYRQ